MRYSNNNLIQMAVLSASLFFAALWGGAFVLYRIGVSSWAYFPCGLTATILCLAAVVIFVMSVGTLSERKGGSDEQRH